MIEKEGILTGEAALEALKIDDSVKKPSFHLFKKNSLLLYMGRCEKSTIYNPKEPDSQLWKGQDKIYNRQFGYILDFIIEDKDLHCKPKIGDIVYVDPYAGEIAPFKTNDGNTQHYYKTVKLDEINLIIK